MTRKHVWDYHISTQELWQRLGIEAIDTYVTCVCTYKLTTSRSHLTLFKDSGRTKMIGKKSRMAVLFSMTRGVSWRREFFSLFSHLNFSQQLSLVKVHNAEPNGDEERRGGDVWFLAWI